MRTLKYDDFPNIETCRGFLAQECSARIYKANWDILTLQRWPGSLGEKLYKPSYSHRNYCYSHRHNNEDYLQLDDGLFPMNSVDSRE